MKLSVRNRRVLARGSIAIGFACIAAETIAGLVTHRSPAGTVLGMGWPVVSVLCGLYYLRATRRRS